MSVASFANGTAERRSPIMPTAAEAVAAPVSDESLIIPLLMDLQASTTEVKRIMKST